MDSRNGSEGAKRKVKGTLHWVSAAENVPFEARLYEPLLMDEEEAAEAEALAAEVKAEVDGIEESPTSGPVLKKDFISKLNPTSIEVCHGFAEKYVADCKVGDTYQFLRMGYYCKDQESTEEMPVFNRVVGLKDSFAKQIKK